MKITIIGYGNLGYSLANALHKHNLLNAVAVKKITDNENLPFITNINSLSQNSDLYIFAIQDQAVKQIIDSHKSIFKDKTLIHCSGSLPSTIFSDVTKNYGVFYPLHSFVKGRQADFSEIPIFITASNNKTENQLITLAEELGSNYKIISDEEREYLHLSAVFAHNFTNHLLTISQFIAQQYNIDFNDIIKLLKPYFEKILQGMPPAKLQTGPAKRNDRPILEKHIKMLEDNKDWQNIYRFVSESIRKTYNSDNENKQEL